MCSRINPVFTMCDGCQQGTDDMTMCRLYVFAMVGDEDAPVQRAIWCDDCADIVAMDAVDDSLNYAFVASVYIA